MTTGFLLTLATGVVTCAALGWRSGRKAAPAEQTVKFTPNSSAALSPYALAARLPLKNALLQLRRLSQTPLDAGQSRQLRLIELSTQAALTSLDDVHQFIMLERGEVTVGSGPVDLRRLLLDAIAGHDEEARRKRVAIEFARPQEELARIQTDAELLAQAIDRLLECAIGRTEVGHILVELLRVSPRGEPAVRIAVSDTDPALEGDQLASMFQAERSSRSGSGYGLALPIARNIARALGGDLTGRIRPGQGACFRLDLPLIPAPAVIDEIAVDLLPGPAHAQVLLAQEPSIDRELTAAMIERCGHETARADTVEHALRLILSPSHDKSKIALALVDGKLPGGGAVALAHQVRAAGVACAKLPIITLSSTPQITTSADGGEIQGHLQRPVSFAELARQFSAWLGPPSSQGATIVPLSAMQPEGSKSVLDARWQKRRAAAMTAVSELVSAPLPPPERCREIATRLHHVATSANLFGEERLGRGADRLERLLRNPRPEVATINLEARRLLANWDMERA